MYCIDNDKKILIMHHLIRHSFTTIRRFFKTNCYKLRPWVSDEIWSVLHRLVLFNVLLEVIRVKVKSETSFEFWEKASYCVGTIYYFSNRQNTTILSFFIYFIYLLLDTYERFHICEVTKEKIQLNDNFTDIHNPIYDEIIKTHENLQ
jgi:hypothetical protein